MDLFKNLVDIASAPIKIADAMVKPIAEVVDEVVEDITGE